MRPETVGVTSPARVVWSSSGMAERWRSIIRLVVMLSVISSTCGVSRYKRCFSDTDCCRHEVCAYGRVCYPTVKCRYGCPDGECRRAADDDPLGTGFETCWPFPPCTSNRDCGHGNVCTMHYNLGYPVCQYNLSIGSSLCYWKRTRASRRRMRPPSGPGSPSERWRAVFVGPSRGSWAPNYKSWTSATTMKTNSISDFM